MEISSRDPAVAPEPVVLAPEERLIDLRAVLAIIRRRLKLALSIGLLVFIACLLIMVRAAPLYTATASVMIDTRREQVIPSQAVLSDLTPDAATVESEVEVLKSRQLADRVVSALHLEQDPEFDPALAAPGVMARIKTGLRALVTPAAPGEPSAEQAAQATRDGVVDRVRSRLVIKRVGGAYVMNLEFSSVDPAKAARIANAFADQYLLEQLQSKFDATAQANGWLTRRLADLRGEVIRNEAAVEQYRAANNLLSASGATLTEQEISTYNQQLASVRAQEAEDEARLRTARSQLAAGSTGEDVGEALNSTVVQQLRNRRAEISGRLADMSSRYGPRHPDMLRAQGELADIDSQIRAEIGRIISNLEARAQVSRERTASMSGSLAGARGALVANNTARVRLNELVRNAEASRTLYEGLLDRFKQTSTQSGLEQSDARVVSRAAVPDAPSSPDVPLTLGVGLGLALCAAAAAIILAEMLDSGLATGLDVERKLGLPLMASVPLIASVASRADRGRSPVDYLIDKPLSAFAESLRALRTSLSFSVAGRPVKLMLITSSLPGEGKSTTAVALARSAALAGQKVIIVDCDLRLRSVHRLFGLDPQVGLLEVLNGQASLDEAMATDPASGAHVLPLSHTPFTQHDVFQSPALDHLLARLRAEFDLVILDTAPVLAVAETRVLASKVDAVVFLARWRRTPLGAIDNALGILQQSGAHVAGVALAQVDMRAQARHGYGDTAFYYRAYKTYYAA